eukprot:2598753-Pyramimonas_sp.AAC.1
MNSWDDDDWGEDENDEGNLTNKSWKQKDKRRQKGQRDRHGEKVLTPEDFVGPSTVASVDDDKERGDYRRVMAVDYGKKRTGVAVSVGGLAPRALDVSIITAKCFGSSGSVIHGCHGAPLVDKLMEIAEAEGAQEFVVGLPTRSVGRHDDRVRPMD